MKAKADFCHSIKPQFFLLDTSSSNFLKEDNIYDIKDVLDSLATRKEVIISVNGKGKMKWSDVQHLHRLSCWYTFFPIDHTSVLQHIKEVVKDLHSLARHLDLPPEVYEELEADFPASTEQRRIELVKKWLKYPSTTTPSCWWQLVRALKAIDYRTRAKKISKKYSKCEIEMIYNSSLYTVAIRCTVTILFPAF